MAIDTKSLTDIITEFRALQSKDAVSPESLGYILQRIVDLLATAGTSETVSNITKLLDGFKAAGQAITALSLCQQIDGKPRHRRRFRVLRTFHPTGHDRKGRCHAGAAGHRP